MYICSNKTLVFMTSNEIKNLVNNLHFLYYTKTGYKFFIDIFNSSKAKTVYFYREYFIYLHHGETIFCEILYIDGTKVWCSPIEKSNFRSVNYLLALCQEKIDEHMLINFFDLLHSTIDFINNEHKLLICYN